MEIVRTIAEVDVLIESTAAHDIYFEEIFLDKYKLKNGASQLDICTAISDKKFVPLYLKWEIIDKCNFSCPFCYIAGHSSNKVVRFNDIKQHIKDFIDQGLLYCVLTGGEVLLHPDFCDIYTFLKEHGVIVEVYTNGSLINDEYIKLFKNLNPYKIEISIYGLGKIPFKRNTNSNYNCSTILKNILHLKENKINVIAKTPVNRLTSAYIDDIGGWCNRHGIVHYFSTDISNGYDAYSLESFSASNDDIIRYDLKNELAYIAKNGYPDNFIKRKKSFSCAVGSYGYHINSKFELLPCSFFNGKINGIDISRHGVKDSLFTLKNYIEPIKNTNMLNCNGCIAYSYCKMCPAIGDIIVAIDGRFKFATNNDYCLRVIGNYSEIYSSIQSNNEQCSHCGATYTVFLPVQKGYIKSEIYYCPECGTGYSCHASSSPRISLLTKRKDRLA